MWGTVARATDVFYPTTLRILGTWTAESQQSWGTICAHAVLTGDGVVECGGNGLGEGWYLPESCRGSLTLRMLLSLTLLSVGCSQGLSPRGLHERCSTTLG